MGKIKLALDLMNDLKRLTESIENLIVEMKAGNILREDSIEFPGIEEGTEDITIERIREVLTAKYQSGKMEEVKGIVKKYGGKKLTDIEPKYYAEILKEAESL